MRAEDLCDFGLARVHHGLEPVSCIAADQGSVQSDGVDHAAQRAAERGALQLRDLWGHAHFRPRVAVEMEERAVADALAGHVDVVGGVAVDGFPCLVRALLAATFLEVDAVVFPGSSPAQHGLLVAADEERAVEIDDVNASDDLGQGDLLVPAVRACVEAVGLDNMVEAACTVGVARTCENCLGDAVQSGASEGVEKG